MAKSKPHVFTEREFDEVYRLVGRFINDWPYLEYALNKGIATTLGMNTLEGVIATSNMQVRSKIHIIKTLINLRGVPKDWCAEAVKTIDAIATMSDHRNTVVHVPFGPHEGGGVEFLPVKAKGKLHFPNMVWGPKQFKAYSREMKKLTNELREIIKKLETNRALFRELDEPTNEKQPPPKTLSHLFRLLQGPDFPLANPETATGNFLGKLGK